jgi:signal peptidase II
MVRLGLALAVLVAVSDQLSKVWILGFLEDHHPVEVTSFFNLVLVGNRGMSFGLFNSDAAVNGLVFTALAVVIVGGLVVWLYRTRDPLLAGAIGLVIGGAAGNVIDRLWRGAVVDFLDFHLGAWHWPAFNLADAAICTGVALMIIDSLLGRREAPN